ncbi:GNAT family N-acetyltransferase [Parvularcula flava]|nr:GNAT family N-acetyltransferase [Aquisalinus luteolus]NHK27547.1 GNAT family N-acetyltransferase [Aquisalinus luteolus]
MIDPEAAASRLEVADVATIGSYWPALKALAADACEPNPFLSPVMLDAACRHLDETQSMKFCLVLSGNRLIGFMPIETQTGYARLPVTYLRTGLYRHCFLGTPLVRNGHEKEFFETIINAANAAGLKGAFLQFRQMIEGGPLETALREVASPHAYIAARWQRACLHSDLPYEGYILQNIRGKKRKEWRRLTNRLSEEGEVQFRTLQHSAELDDWCEHFLRLEHDGWRGHGGSSLAADETGPAFLKEIVRSAHEAGQLHFLRLDVDDKCIGMLINFTAGGQGWSFKIAHDAEYARYSPGVMLELELTRQALDEKTMTRVDSCAQEDHPMIDKLWAERQAMCHVNVPLPGLSSRSASMLCRFLEETSERTRRMLGTKGVRA